MLKLWTEITNNDREGTDAQAPAIQPGTTGGCCSGGLTGACIYAKLSAKDNYWYCADSTGMAGYTSTNPSTLCAGSSSCTCPAVTG